MQSAKLRPIPGPYQHFVLLGIASILLTSNADKALSQSPPPAPTPVQVPQSSPPIVSFDTLFQRHLQEMTPEQRKAFVLQLAQTGRYFNVPELWQIDNPNTILQALTHFPEPYDPVMLDALERVLPRLQNVQDTDPAAAILYRYHRKSGEDYFKRRLIDNGDIVSATIFADNQDDTLLETILKLYQQDTQHSEALVPYLARWKSPSVAPALLKGFQANQEDANYANALAEQQEYLSPENRLEAVALARKQYNLAKPDEPAKIIAASALIRMGADPEDKMFSFLLSGLKSKRVSDFNKHEIIVQLQYLSPKRVTPLLEEIIKNYTDLTPSSLQKQLFSSSGVITSASFATTAAKSLAALHAVSSSNILLGLLQKLHNTYSSPELQERTALALLNVGGPQAEIAKVMGSRWLVREIAKRQLRPLPDNLIPVALVVFAE